MVIDAIAVIFKKRLLTLHEQEKLYLFLDTD